MEKEKKKKHYLTTEQNEAFWKGKLLKKDKDGSLSAPEMKEIEVIAPRIIKTNIPKQRSIEETLDNINNNPIINFAKIADPTGISSYYDVFKSGKRMFNNPSWKNAGTLGLDVLGAFPMISPAKFTIQMMNKIGRNYKAAKLISNNLNNGIKFYTKSSKHILNPVNKKIASTVGLPEANSETFYHYLYKPTKGNIKGKGMVNISNGFVNPVKSNFNSKDVIWWNKGNVPKSGDRILVSKSPAINERVIDHPEIYSPMNGSYNSSYYTSGKVPLNEVSIYDRNPFTGNYDKMLDFSKTPKRIKQKRLQLDEPTYQPYYGPKHLLSEVINPDKSVNLKNLMKIESEVLQRIPGGYKSTRRLENPEWHKTDWNTFLHSKDTYILAKNAGYSREELAPVLFHDAGKLFAGEGHGPYGASLFQQVFKDSTPEQVMAIYERMGTPKTRLGQLVKNADIKNIK